MKHLEYRNASDEMHSKGSARLRFLRWTALLLVLHFLVGLPVGFLAIRCLKSPKTFQHAAGMYLRVWHEPLFSLLTSSIGKRVAPPFGVFLMIANSALWGVAGAAAVTILIRRRSRRARMLARQ